MEIRERYEKSPSLRELARDHNVSKSTIRKALHKGFVDEETMAKWKTKRKGGATPYGYVVVNGYFKKHPKEQEVVRIIMNLR